MAERNDDIKQLFSHLGLNPDNYQELRTPPKPRGSVDEASRRRPLSRSGQTHRPVTSSSPTGIQEPRTYTRAPAGIRPMQAMPSLAPPASPRPIAPVAAVERSPLLSFFEAVKEPISNFASVPPGPEVSPKTEANRAVTDRMIQEIKDISRRISRDMSNTPRSRWADLPEISKPLQPVPVSSTPRDSAFSVQGTARSSDTPKLKLKLSPSQKGSSKIGEGPSLKDVFQRLADSDPGKS